MPSETTPLTPEQMAAEYESRINAPLFTARHHWLAGYRAAQSAQPEARSMLPEEHAIAVEVLRRTARMVRKLEWGTTAAELEGIANDYEIRLAQPEAVGAKLSEDEYRNLHELAMDYRATTWPQDYWVELVAYVESLRASARAAAIEEAAKVCEAEICACCWDEDAQVAGEHCAAAIRNLAKGAT